MKVILSQSSKACMETVGISSTGGHFVQFLQVWKSVKVKGWIDKQKQTRKHQTPLRCYSGALLWKQIYSIFCSYLVCFKIHLTKSVAKFKGPPKSQIRYAVLHYSLPFANPEQNKLMKNSELRHYGVQNLMYRTGKSSCQKSMYQKI